MYCGMDLGTSGIKCGIFDPQGRRLGMGRHPVRLHRGKEPGSAYAYPSEWATAAREALAAALSESGLAPSSIRAIALSGNGPTLVALGADGQPVCPALSWMDRRAKAQAERIAALSGRPVDPSFYLPKALRLLEGAAEGMASKKAPALFMSGPEYLAHVLGADPVSYLPDPYYESYIWDRPSADALGLEPSLFPPYVRPGELIGRVSAAAAERFGLAAGTPIAAAFPDFLAALAGSGTMRPGMACDRSGSSEALNLCAAAPFGDRRLFSLPHAVAGLWNQSGGVSTSGKAMEWLGGIFSHGTGRGKAGGSGRKDGFRKGVFADFRAARPGAGGALFLPYLSGERAPLWEPSLRASFVGLSLDVGRRDLARAVAEGIVYGIRYWSDIMAEGQGAPELIRCSGGGAKDDELCALKADILGIAVEVPETPECETLGDACAAAVALGDYADIASAAGAMVRPGKRFLPSPALRPLYDDAYGRWRQALRAQLDGLPPAPQGML